MKKIEKSQLNSGDFFNRACIFEASLVAVAIVLGWLAGLGPFDHLYFSEMAILTGLLGTIPLLLMFIAMSRLELGSFRQIRQLLLDTLGPHLHHYHWTDLFVLASIAGISEEVLFRGVIQPWMEELWGYRAGLFGSNIIFGLVHAVTPLYAVLAFLVGIYLGLFLDYGGERNLLVPVIIHGLYDFLAFVLLVRDFRGSQVL
ncbi:MAG: CPBP family intramembrane glutamic endopeptidase [Gammaproteobacteria bacterium]